MPDFLLLAEAIFISTVVAGMVLLATTWPGRSCAAWRRRVGWILALAAGFYAGCGVFGELPRWPAPDDRDRFLVILLPLTVIVEIAVTCWPRRRVAVLLRAVLVAVAAPILLHNSVYLADLSGPNSAEWSPALACLILFALAALLAGVWGLLARLPTPASGQSIAPVLMLVALAAGICVMLSGYYKGGLFGLPLAGALAGAMLAARVAKLPSAGNAALGIGLIGIFTILVIGRFFGSLPTSMALMLMFAPLLAWTSEMPGVRRRGATSQTVVRWVCVAIPLIALVAWAQMRFTRAFSAPSAIEQSLRSGR
jgi:hypothetical protein